MTIRQQRLFIAAFILLLSIGLIFAPTTSAQVTTFTVTNSDDSGGGSLRQAIADAAASPGSNNLIEFADGVGTITLATAITINDATAITTIDGSNDTTGGVNIQAASGLNALTVNTTNTVNLQNLRFSSDGTGAGVLHQNGTLSITNVTFNQLTSANGAAVLSQSGTLNLTDVVATNLTATGTGAAIKLEGDSVLGTASNIEIRELSATSTGSGLRIETTSNTPMTITNSSFYNARGTQSSGIIIFDGNLSLTNVSIFGNSGIGMVVAADGTATLSFVSIAGNIGTGLQSAGTVNAKNIIINEDECQITGPPINIQDRNFVGVDCVTTPVSGGIVVNDDPLTFTGSNIVQLGTDSPAIDRVASCTDFNGNTVTVDQSGTTRPERLSCDVGAFERVGVINAGDLVVPPTLPTLTESTTPATINVQDLTLDTLPIPGSSVVFTLTVPPGDGGQSDCQLIDVNNGNAAVTTLDITFNQTNWDNNPASTEFGIQAVSDAVAEGDHTCQVDATINAGATTDELYTSANDGATIQLLFPITDDDLTIEPAITYDYSGIAINLGDDPALRLEESDSDTREIRVTLDAPPTAAVEVWAVPGDSPTQECNASFTEALPGLLTAANWDTGLAIRINAIPDGIQENVLYDCSITVNARYTANGNQTNDNSVNAVIEPDPEQILTITPDATQLTEGQLNTLIITLSNPIGLTSPDTYTLNFLIQGTDAADNITPGNRQCDITDSSSNVIASNELTLNNTNANTDNAGIITIGIRAIADGNTGENGTGCVLSTTVTTNVAGTAITVPDLDFNIERDLEPASSAILSVTQQDNGADLIADSSARTANLTEEGTSFVAWDFNIDRDVTENVTIRVFESASGPRLQDNITGEPLTTPQCSIRLSNSIQTLSNEAIFTLNSTDDTFTVLVEPVDDAYAEDAFTHTCDVSVERTNGTATELDVFTYNINISDTDENQILTDPDMLISRPTVVEGNAIAIRYVFTSGYTFTNDPQELRLQLRTTTPDACAIQLSGSNAFNVDFVRSPATGTNLLVLVTVITFGVNADTNCDISASVAQIPNEYTATITNVEDIPDISLLVINDEAVPDPTDPPREGEQDIDDIATDTGTTSGVVTSTPDSTQAAASTTPLATATPDNVPSVTLLEGVTVLPVRTGPYLGATFVTLATRENEFGGTRTYRVLARNNDENADVTWFKVVVNGKIGWASGLSLTLNNITEEQLPTDGSVFDTIDGAPDLGVTGLVVSDRLVYRRPSTRTSTLGFVIPGNTTVSILGRTREFPFDDWYQVSFGGQTGWILTDSRLEEPAVIVNEDVIRETVPVR